MHSIGHLLLYGEIIGSIVNIFYFSSAFVQIQHNTAAISSVDELSIFLDYESNEFHEN